MKKYFAYFFLLLLIAPLLGVLSVGAIYQKHTNITLQFNRVQNIEEAVLQNILQLSPEIVIHLIGVSKNQFILEEGDKYNFDASLFCKWNELHQKTSFLFDKLTNNQASEFTFITFLNFLFYSNNQIDIIENENFLTLNEFHQVFIFYNVLDILTPPPRL